MKFSKFPKCQECQNKILQPDLFNNLIELCGCTELTKQEWTKGLKRIKNRDGISYQSKCPLNNEN